MPIKSPAQYRLMQAAAHGRGYGPSPQIAREFINATSKPERKKLATGYNNKKRRST